MPDPPKLSSGWETFEIIHKDGNGQHTVTPFRDELRRSGKVSVQAVTKMQLVQDLGWPEARRQLKDDRGRHLIVKKDDVVWLLKCKPKCWRLYFYVWQNEEKNQRRLVYLHAVCKKQDKEDPADAVEARNAFDRIGPGGSAITPFEFFTR